MTKFVPWLVWLFLYWTMVWPRPWPKRRKRWGLAGLAGLIFPYHLLRRISYLPSGEFLESWPHTVWLAAQFLYCTSVFLCLFAGLDILFQLVSGYGRKKGVEPWYRRQLIRFSVVLPVSAALSVLGIYMSLRPPLVREYTLKLKTYPPGAGELRIAAVSDLHFDPVYDSRYAARIVSKLNSLKPDVILLLGDYSNTLNGVTPAVLAELTKLSSPEGVFAVTGNHEYYPEGKYNFSRLDSIGIHFLCNESVKLNKGNVCLAGVNDLILMQLDGGSGREYQLPQVRDAVKNIPDGGTVILLSHQPKLFPDAVQNGIGLQLSGHIHGGLFPVLHWIMMLMHGPVHGYFQQQDTSLIVSSGTGIWCGFPCRFGIQPEVLLVRVSGGN